MMREGNGGWEIGRREGERSGGGGGGEREWWWGVLMKRCLANFVEVINGRWGEAFNEKLTRENTHSLSLSLALSLSLSLS